MTYTHGIVGGIALAAIAIITVALIAAMAIELLAWLFRSERLRDSDFERKQAIERQYRDREDAIERAGNDFRDAK